MMKRNRLTRGALLTAAALTIFLVEMMIPPIVPIPGVKLGLANIITLVAMMLIGPVDTLLILLARILLGGMFSGQIMSILYSFSGGILCYLTMLLLRKHIALSQIWAMSIVGAIAHNIGQIAMAILVTRTWELILYLPVLMVSGILTGLFTGLAAQAAAVKLKGKL
ncbi:MAG: Gx transporter family protein [Oscillospiraceae bacterium]|nr:Gx transporter family protein [Oscillospiraceae bacterium]